MTTDSRITPAQDKTANDAGKNNASGSTQGLDDKAKQASNLSWDRGRKGE